MSFVGRRRRRRAELVAELDGQQVEQREGRLDDDHVPGHLRHYATAAAATLATTTVQVMLMRGVEHVRIVVALDLGEEVERRGRRNLFVRR